MNGIGDQDTAAVEQDEMIDSNSSEQFGAADIPEDESNGLQQRLIQQIMARKSQISETRQRSSKAADNAKPASIMTKSEEKKVQRPVGFPETPDRREQQMVNRHLSSNTDTGTIENNVSQNISDPLNSFLYQDEESMRKLGGYDQSIVMRQDGARQNARGDQTFDMLGLSETLKDMDFSMSNVGSLISNSVLANAQSRNASRTNSNSILKGLSLDPIQEMISKNKARLSKQPNAQKQKAENNKKHMDALDNIKPPSMSMDESHKSGGFLQAPQEPNKIGFQEISFIKKDQTSFVDTFLEEQERLLEAQKYKLDQSQDDDSMLDGDHPLDLFRDIVEEEFDLDLLGEAPQAIENFGAIGKGQDQSDSGSDSDDFNQQRKYMINTICEKDEEQSEEVSDDEEEKKGFKTQEREKNRKTSTYSDHPLLHEHTATLKRRLLPEDQEGLSSSLSALGDESNKSLDSVDKLWKLALNQNDSFDQEGTSSKRPSEHDEETAVQERSQFSEQMEGEQNQEKSVEQEKEEESDTESIDRTGLQKKLGIMESEDYQKMLKGLVSFDFPSSRVANLKHVNLKHYQRYFKNQMNLAPSTDSRLTHMTLQTGFVGEEKSTGIDQGIENYQDLGCVGFYGIQNDDDNMISIILLTNCSDIFDAANTSRKTSGGFNNVQQYVVPDVQMNLLKRALKKIIQQLIKNQKEHSEQERLMKNVQKESKSKKQEVNPEKYGDDNEELQGFLMKEADFGVLLLLGKLYFHVCKFKQSLFSLNLAIQKCKNQSKVHERDLAESLLWSIFVQHIYFINKLRVLQNYQINKKHNQDNKRAFGATIVQSEIINTQQETFVGAPYGFAAFDPTQVAVSQEIFDIYRSLQENIDEYLDIQDKQVKNRPVVLYISLKLELFRYSDLFKELVNMQAEYIRHKETQAVKNAAVPATGGGRRNRKVSQSSKGASMEQVAAQERRDEFRDKKSKSFVLPVGRSFNKNRTQSDSDMVQENKPAAVTITESGFEQRNRGEPLSAGLKKKPAVKPSVFRQLRQGLHKGGQPNTPTAQINKKNARTLSQIMGDVSMDIKPNSAALRPAEKSTTDTVRFTAHIDDLTDRQRRETVYREEKRLETLTKAAAKENVQDIIGKILASDPYIGCVAQSEFHFWMMRTENKGLSLQEEGVQILEMDGSSHGSAGVPMKSSDIDLEHLEQGCQVLEELVVDKPHRILASIKLWQYYRSQGSENEMDEGSWHEAQQIAERLQYLYDNARKEAQAEGRKLPILDNIEARLLVTLINVKSYYDASQFETCFELLQNEYLRNSKYTGLLYLYGKYIIKSNGKTKDDPKQKDLEQARFLGSGVGAMEECLKSCMPDYHSRIYYYIGYAYNDKNSPLYMPLKSVHFWQQAKDQEFNLPYQGIQKLKMLKKFLDQYAFIQQIVELINKGLTSDSRKDTASLQAAAEQYISVLNGFQEKVDGPSSLLLKSHIYAYNLNNEKLAQACFEELITKYPQFINGYLEYWQYLRELYKTKKSEASKQAQEAKKMKQQGFQDPSRKQKFKEQYNHALELLKGTKQLHSKLKRITQKALTQSNACNQTSTSEWVRVRIIAAKTYLIDKKFNKAIHVLTDLCYVIPPDMLKLNEDRANLMLYEYDDNANRIDHGGIRFCTQILQEEDDDGEAELGEQDESPFELVGQDSNKMKQSGSPKRKNVQDQLFANRIFIDHVQEREMVEDFEQTVDQSNFNSLKNTIRESEGHSSAAEQDIERSQGAYDTEGNNRMSNIETTRDWDMQNFRAQRPDDTNPTFDARLRGVTKVVQEPTVTNSFQIELPPQDYSFNVPSLQTPAKKKKYDDIFDEDALQSLAKMEFEVESITDKDEDENELFVQAAYHTTDAAGSRTKKNVEQDEVGFDDQQHAGKEQGKKPFAYAVPSLDLNKLNQHMPDGLSLDDRLQMTEKPMKKLNYTNDIEATAQQYQSVQLSNTYTTQSKQLPRRRASFGSRRNGLNDAKQSTVSRRCSMVFTPASKLRKSAMKASINGKLNTNRQVMQSTNFGDGQDRLLLAEDHLNYTARQMGQYATRPRDSNQLQTNKKTTVRASVFDVREYKEFTNNPLVMKNAHGGTKIQVDQDIQQKQQNGMEMDFGDHQYGDESIGNPNDELFGDIEKFEEEEQRINSTIFAVNSDVYFLYMIGKMCAETGHNLHQGLSALNDYYLFMWHHGISHSSSEQSNNTANRNPLNYNFASNLQNQRIKQCVKTLICIGRIYEQLSEPLLAQTFYLKILEDRESLCKYFGCKDEVLEAEELSGKIFMQKIGNKLPGNTFQKLGEEDAAPILNVEQIKIEQRYFEENINWANASNKTDSKKNQIISTSLNQHQVCFASGTESGFNIFNCQPFKQLHARNMDGGIGIAEMMFQTNVVALVGGGERPRFATNKVMFWDDLSQQTIGELSFKTYIKAVRLTKDRVVVVLETRVYVYKFDDLRLVDAIETSPNPQGLIALNLDPDSPVPVLAVPDKNNRGHVLVKFYKVNTYQEIKIKAHQVAVTAICLNFSGTLLATASEKGTLIRIFSTESSDPLQELRRGAEKAEIHSISFDMQSQWLACSSDRETIHIFSVTASHDNKAIPINLTDEVQSFDLGENDNAEKKNAPANQKSKFNFMKGILPKYFDSHWSYARFKLPTKDAASETWTCAFNREGTNIYVLGSKGSFVVAAIPKQKGNCKILLKTNFI